VRQQKRRASEPVEGHYLLPANQPGEDPAVLWQRCIQLTQIEAPFQRMKGDLGLRPISPQRQQRVAAHVSVAFQG